MALGEYFLYLVGDDGIETATKRVEFNEFQIIVVDNVGCSTI